MLSLKQLEGLTVRIVTWKPDFYGFGETSNWMELYERMRLAGFYVNLVENYCEHYCIIDRKIL